MGAIFEVFQYLQTCEVSSLQRAAEEYRTLLTRISQHDFLSTNGSEIKKKSIRPIGLQLFEVILQTIGYRRKQNRVFFNENFILFFTP